MNKWNALKDAINKQIKFVNKQYNRANSKMDAQVFEGAKAAYMRVLEMMEHIETIEKGK